MELVDHNPEWDTIANQIIERLWHVFGSTAKDIQHFGSTSIRGIKAKPSISIAVAVDDMEQVAPLIPRIEKDDYMTYKRDGDTWKVVVYADPTHTVETYAIMVAKSGSQRFRDALRFRDYLNANPDAAKRYEAHKLESASKANNDRTTYKKSKTDFMKQLLEEMPDSE